MTMRELVGIICLTAGAAAAVALAVLITAVIPRFDVISLLFGGGR